MPSKLLALRRPDTCKQCSSEIPLGTRAWWDAVAKNAECSNCRAVASRVEFSATDESGWLIKYFDDEPRSSGAPQNAKGGCKLSAHLHERLLGRAVVLDDRRIPGMKANVDHIVVAPSGVWVVDTKNHDGKVERRDVGGWFKVDERLYVAGKDRSHLVDGLDRHVIAVENLLVQAGLTSVPVHAALCFTNSEWGWFAKPFSMSGVWVTWPEKLTDLVMEWKAIPDSEFDSLARAVAARLSSTR